jgi:hypothetical protein
LQFHEKPIGGIPSKYKKVVVPLKEFPVHAPFQDTRPQDSDDASIESIPVEFKVGTNYAIEGILRVVWSLELARQTLTPLINTKAAAIIS